MQLDDANNEYDITYILPFDSISSRRLYIPLLCVWRIDQSDFILIVTGIVWQIKLIESSRSKS